MHIPTETTSIIQQKIGDARGRYPEARAACLPSLHLVQEHLGYVSAEAVDLVAAALDLPPSFVQGVATFYSMYQKRPIGRYHLQLCTSVSCGLNGAEELWKGLQSYLGIGKGETSPDGFTLTEVECLAACGSGPVLQVNDTYHEHMDLAKAKALIDELRARSTPARTEA
jgi:NADH-quinone oxidoreductase subunit E